MNAAGSPRIYEERSRRECKGEMEGVGVNNDRFPGCEGCAGICVRLLCVFVCISPVENYLRTCQTVLLGECGFLLKVWYLFAAFVNISVEEEKIKLILCAQPSFTCCESRSSVSHTSLDLPSAE